MYFSARTRCASHFSTVSVARALSPVDTRTTLELSLIYSPLLEIDLMAVMIGDFIDFADIKNQIERREKNRIFEFNLMLVGKIGVGKSTLVKSLFKGLIKPENPDRGAELHEYVNILEENKVRLRLRCIESSNYKKHESKHYTDYIDQKLRTFFLNQIRHSSWNIEDQRVHCCLYLIEPYGKMKLQEEDIECMKALHNRVNLVPVIVGADRFNSNQLEEFKLNIKSALCENGIRCFEFTPNEKEDEERSRAIKKATERFPFAIVSADEPVTEDGRTRWVRTTGLGSIDIFESRVYDFDALAKLLIRHCMLDLMDTTHIVHYAEFKRQILNDAYASGGESLKRIGLDQTEVLRILRHSNNRDLASSCVKVQ